MSNTQHNVIRVIAVVVLVALHWFPHTHAAPLLATSAANGGNQAVTEHADADPVTVATTP
jgi:hypothetical protein